MSDVKESVRARYAEAAKRVADACETSCCGEKKKCGCGEKSKTALYDPSQIGDLPDKAVLASLGCGNPTALAELKAGETVLDLGSGGGIDVLLSARRVGPTGKAYGLDMTDEMLEAAGRTVKASGFDTIRLLKGVLERIPLADGSVDAIISNCVINLAGDKAAVLREALRVLRPGGRLCVADTTFSGSVPDAIRSAGPEAWCG